MRSKLFGIASNLTRHINSIKDSLCRRRSKLFGIASNLTQQMIFRILRMIHANATNVPVLPQKQNIIYHCVDPRLLTQLLSFICWLVESIRQLGWFEVGSKLRGSFDMTMVATEDFYRASEEHALPFLSGELSHGFFSAFSFHFQSLQSDSMYVRT
jgi:hypothetical protein